MDGFIHWDPCPALPVRPMQIPGEADPERDVREQDDAGENPHLPPSAEDEPPPDIAGLPMM